MSNYQSLGSDVSLAAAAAQTAVDLGKKTPYLPGQQAVGVIAQLAGAGSFVAKIQTSPDNSTWTDAVTMTGAKPSTFVQFTLDRYVRANVTAAGSAGTANFGIITSM